MKIAVMGMGVAGSYLVSRLKNDHEVVGFERMDEIKHDSICAWGSIKSTMIDLCKKSGIDFEKYVVHDGKKMYVDMNNQERFQIGLHGLCTYEKLSLIKDFIKDSFLLRRVGIVKQLYSIVPRNVVRCNPIRFVPKENLIISCSHPDTTDHA